jgi:predicted HTH domain antitoxin
MRISKGERILEVTDKVYEVIYKQRGYTPYNGKDVDEKKVIKIDKVIKEDDIEIAEIAKLEELTVAELKEKLDERGIEYDSKLRKQELVDLLGSD